jgi:ATP-dependent DNA helicase PIF1
MRHLKLVRNMRAHGDPWFSDYLLCIGSGTEVVNCDGEIRLPDKICVPYTSNDSDLDRLWKAETTSPKGLFYLHLMIG